MKYVTGEIYTESPVAAAAARFAFFDYLTEKQFDVAAYWSNNFVDYTFVVENMPTEVWARFAKVWNGEDAVYPWHAGCKLRAHFHPERTLTYSI